MSAIRATGRGGVGLCRVGQARLCTGGACAADRRICQAIVHRAVIEFDYDGIHRIVEPHYYGLTSQDNQAIRGYQTNWGGVKSQEPNWHIFRLDNIDNLQVTTTTFRELRADYNPDDSQMNGYYARA